MPTRRNACLRLLLWLALLLPATSPAGTVVAITRVSGGYNGLDATGQFFGDGFSPTDSIKADVNSASESRSEPSPRDSSVSAALSGSRGPGVTTIKADVEAKPGPFGFYANAQGTVEVISTYDFGITSNAVWSQLHSSGGGGGNPGCSATHPCGQGNAPITGGTVATFTGYFSGTVDITNCPGCAPNATRASVVAKVGGAVVLDQDYYASTAISVPFTTAVGLGISNYGKIFTPMSLDVNVYADGAGSLAHLDLSHTFEVTSITLPEGEVLLPDGYFASAVPLPAALPLLVSALGLLVGVRRTS